MPTKKRPIRKKAARKTKLGIRINKDPKLLKRLKQLDVSPIHFDSMALELLAELEQRNGGLTPATARSWDAAVVALKAEAFASEDAGKWLNAARRAVGLG